MSADRFDLPVTTDIADVGGRELWGYPKFVTALGRGLTLRVGDAQHPMADRLRALGLEEPHPVAAQAGTHLQMMLPSGEPLAFQRAA